MKKETLLVLAIVFTALFLISFSYSKAATSVFKTFAGGTGTTTPSGILYGDNGATTHLNTLIIGSNLTLSGGTLSATAGGSTFGYPFPSDATTTALSFTNGAQFGTTTSLATVSVQANAAGTVGLAVFGHQGGDQSNDIFEVKKDPSVNYLSVNSSGALNMYQQAQFTGPTFGQFQDTTAGASMDFKTVAGTGDITFTPNNTREVTFSNNGNVGIGTSTPGATLGVNGSELLTGNLSFSTAVSNIFVPQGVANALSFATSSGATPIMTLSSLVGASGALGIGSSSPWGKLSVEMGGLNPAFVVSNQGSTTPAFIISGVNQNGTIGMSTSTPFAMLSINPIPGSPSVPFAIGSSSATQFMVDTTGGTGTGLSVQTKAAAGGLILQTLSTGANEAATFTSKGTGTTNVGSSNSSLLSLTNSQIQFQIGASTKMTITTGGTTFGQAANSNAATIRFGYTGAADTNLTASTEAPSTYFNMGQTRQHSTGALALQRDFRITGSTHSFVGASTLATAAAFSVDGPDSGGTNATISTSTAIYLPTKALTNVTTGIGLYVEAPTGATNNYAAEFLGGNVGIGTTTATAALTAVAASTTAGTVPNKYQGLVNIIAGLENTTTVLFQEIDQWGHLLVSGDAITLTSCVGGSVNANSNDRAGAITFGTGLTSCGVLFSHPYPAGTTVHVFVNQDSGTLISSGAQSVSTTGFTITAASIATGDVFSYQVVASQ